jgi:hypothetical protein
VWQGDLDGGRVELFLADRAARGVKGAVLGGGERVGGDRGEVGVVAGTGGELLMVQLEGLTFFLDGTARGVGAGLTGAVRGGYRYQIYVGVEAAVHSFNVMLTSER